MPQPLAAVFVGSDTLLQTCLDAWISRGHRVVAVVTDTDKVRRFCEESGLRCLDANGEFVSELAGEEIDFLFAITWLSLLSDEALRLPRRCAVNFHDGPLPRYAGLNATCWAIEAGEAEHGITWHVVEPRADSGDILLQKRFAIEPDDTAFTLNARCFEAGQRSFVELVEQFEEDAATPRPQDLSQRTWFGSKARPEALAVVDFARPAGEVARRIRAFDHGGYQNPVAVAKVRAPKGVFVPTGVEALPRAVEAAPGTVASVDAEGVSVACGEGAVRLLRPRALEGAELDTVGLGRLGVTPGAVLPGLDSESAASLTELGRVTAEGERAWVENLRRLEPLPVPGGTPAGREVREETLAVRLGSAADVFETGALIACFLVRDGGRPPFSIGLRTASLDECVGGWADVATASVPARIDFPAGEAFETACREVASSLRLASDRGPVLRDVLFRYASVLPSGATLDLPVELRLGTGAGTPRPGRLSFVVAEPGSVELRYDANALPTAAAESLAKRLEVFARATAETPDTPVECVPVLDEEELRRVLHEWNDTAAEAPAEPCIHRQFAATAARLGDAIALQHRGDELSYRELARRVEALAGRLRACGVGRGDRVGLFVSRGIGMVVAVLATMRCGAAYVPLDPSYPADRLAFMADDAELRVLVVDAETAAKAPGTEAPVVDLDTERDAIAAAVPPAEDPTDGEDLAYVIYTSGSTGRPKGVMVRHRNVANFFLGMDRALGFDPDADEPGVWLAVTSLSFDISVLELLWTLCRGFRVVVGDGEGRSAQEQRAGERRNLRPVSFSMFYFASDEGEHAEDKYRLLLDGARFADENGFEAVWTPERHFHAFGGLYPNPSVASAAIASITSRVGIRSGSCVGPLHHPIRIAEEWALVDNLSRGRVGLGFAAGWHARDFVLRPESFADRKQVMMDSLRQVQSLWRGEAVEFPGHDGKPVSIKTLPRPVQPELPTWITVAGNPETYRMAGEAGCFVLTHLLGQSLEELQQKLDVYREAWRAAGHDGEGRVTLMLHTFVGDDDERVRDIVREPMKSYLRSSIDLVKQAAWSFPAFKNRVDGPGEMDRLFRDGLTPADLEDLLEFSFDRYYRTSALFGTPETCTAMVDRLRAMGIDEIACLVDFGVPTGTVLENLPHLLELKRRTEAREQASRSEPRTETFSEPTASLPELIERHGVTHFQCTPSMASMLLLDPAAPAALARLDRMLVGGEALPGPLARELRSHVANLIDVYGPTETTVWSTSQPVGDEDSVPIGRPLANQRAYVLDAARQPVAIGAVGELWIAGDGVTAGYFRRPELTAERFVDDPFLQGGKMYRTGDLARWRSDGVLEYLGRTDHQVKVRGHRIELGEIESVLGEHPGVRECAVTARSEAAEARLCAYYVAGDPAPDADELRAHLRGSLPEFMLPSWFVALPALPRTPNLKIDRKVLPAPEAAAPRRSVTAAQNETEDAILAIWKGALGTDAVGVEDNFFDSGGHSILAVMVHREICKRLGVELQITDLFRFPTVRALARHLGRDREAPSAAQKAAARAQKRRLLRRR